MFYEKVSQSAAYIREKTALRPQIAIILGSGLGALVDAMEDRISIPYAEIPHFPVSTVQGHAGNLVIGRIGSATVAAMQGRFHYYEGYTMQDVVLPVRVMKMMGVKTLIVTNACGGVNLSFAPGDLMVISDYLTLTGVNPLMGKNLDEFGPRFPDMSCVFDKELRALAHETAKAQGFTLQEGVYCQFPGPCYETPAEIRMARILGADAVGMSTVPEAQAARHCGMRVLGISCITNMAAGILDQPLCHEEVTETANRVKERFKGLLDGVIAKL